MEKFFFKITFSLFDKSSYKFFINSDESKLLILNSSESAYPPKKCFCSTKSIFKPKLAKFFAVTNPDIPPQRLLHPNEHKNNHRKINHVP